MKDSDIPYEERGLIQRAIRNAHPFAEGEPRWVMVKRLFGTGAIVSAAICKKYGFDPDAEVPPLTSLSVAEYPVFVDPGPESYDESGRSSVALAPSRRWRK